MPIYTSTSYFFNQDCYISVTKHIQLLLPLNSPDQLTSVVLFKQIIFQCFLTRQPIIRITYVKVNRHYLETFEIMINRPNICNCLFFWRNKQETPRNTDLRIPLDHVSLYSSYLWVPAKKMILYVCCLRYIGQGHRIQKSK